MKPQPHLPTPSPLVTREMERASSPRQGGELASSAEGLRSPGRSAVAAVVTGLLFFGWLGYLFFLVQTRPQAPGGGPVVLSRPQFLISELDVIARIDSIEGPVVIEEVVYPPTLARSGLVGQSILVPNLDQCLPIPRLPEKVLRQLGENLEQAQENEKSFPDLRMDLRGVHEYLRDGNYGKAAKEARTLIGAIKAALRNVEPTARNAGWFKKLEDATRKVEETLPPLDFTRPGRYILALTLSPTSFAQAASLAGLAAGQTGGVQLVFGQLPQALTTTLSYEVVPTPASPGYPNPNVNRPGPPRIYPAIPANLAQLRQIQSRKESEP